LTYGMLALTTARLTSRAPRGITSGEFNVMLNTDPFCWMFEAPVFASDEKYIDRVFV